MVDLVGVLLEQRRIAVDTEFHRERTYHPKVALLQVAWSDGLALVDPLAVDLRAFAPVLASDVLFVMHAAGQDLEVFDRACGTGPRHLFDTQLAAGFVGLSTPSLSSLCERELGIRLPKGDRLSDWLARPLSGSQLEYAAADVAHLLAIHDRLVADLGRRGRLAWAEDEFRLLLERDRGPRDPHSAWERIKELKRLRGDAFARGRALAAWRERTADQLDLPVRTVLPDLALVAIAQGDPGDEEALRAVRGVDGRHLRNGAAAKILSALRGAGDLPAIEGMNTAAVPAVNELSAEEVAWFAEATHTFLVAEVGGVGDGPDGAPAPAGFLFGLEGPGIDYASANYRWFCERYERFLYVDRIVVDPPAQGLGVGRSLYEAFAVRADGQSHLCAEVNVRPRNDRSLAFHEAFGFRAVGEQETGSEGKRVRMFALEL